MVLARLNLRERQIELAIAVLDHAVGEEGSRAFRHVRMTELLLDHLHLASSDEAMALLAEIRRRGG